MPSFVGLSIGCNKGQDAVRLARLGLGAPAFDAKRWIGAIDGPGANWACGKGERAEGDERDLVVRTGEVHCVEPMPANFVALRNASAALGLDEEGGWVLRQAAIASVDGAVRFPDRKRGECRR